MARALTGYTDIDARGLLRAIGDEFQSRGWSDNSDLALKITQDAQTLRRLDAKAAAALANRGFLLRNRTSRAKLRGALASVFAGRNLLDPDLDHPHTMPAPQHTNITIGDGNTGVNINVGGQQVNVTVQSAKDDVLAGVAALLRDALQGELPATQFTQLDQLISAREDFDQKDIETITAEVIEQGDPPPSKLAQLRNSVMTSAASGLLVQGIIAGLNAL
jgi:hypothetical protein